jgi:hypothetical protein
MTLAVIHEVPAYAAMTSPRQRQAVHEHSTEHVHAVIRAIEMWALPTPEELAFVKARAALRVRQQLPLSALLHAYRLGHRTVWECLVRIVADFDNALDASLALTTLTLSYTELISAAIAEAYVDQQRSIFVHLDRARRDLLDAVLQNVRRGAETLSWHRASRWC